MAFFGVTVEEISKVEHHPNADRLDVAELKGLLFSFVTGRDQFKVGDKVLYFPIDSIIPQSTAEKLGVFGKLGGSGKDRLKTVRLRGCMSQGIVGPISLIDELLKTNPTPTSEDITNFFGITKYDPESLIQHRVCADWLKPLHYGQGVYDIEGVQRNSKVLDIMMDQEVYITEKCEGQFFSIDVNQQGNVHVNQRRFSVKDESSENTIKQKPMFWSYAESTGLIDAAKKFSQFVFENRLITNYDFVVIMGEMIGPGIQKNWYKLSKPEVRLFDIRLGLEKYVDSPKFFEYAATFFPNHKTVPLLFFGKTLRDWCGSKTVIEASNGQSVINPACLREGIVLKCSTEQYVDHFGRCILKVRDPIYLEKTDS